MNTIYEKLCNLLNKIFKKIITISYIGKTRLTFRFQLKIVFIWLKLQIIQLEIQSLLVALKQAFYLC